MILRICVLFLCILTISAENRVKRSKFFPSLKYIRRPYRSEFPFPKGYYSNTPPPNYVSDEMPNGLNGANNAIDRMKINKKPMGNLKDEDVTNLFKNLSEGDLDRILDIAKELKIEANSINSFNTMMSNGNSITYTNNMHSNKVNMNTGNDLQFNNLIGSINPAILFTDSKTVKEEELPKPINLREEPEYTVAHTKYMPSYVQPVASYKVESFGDLPLTEKANSKLSSVSSYHVPHYSVTSNTASTSSGGSSVSPSAMPDIKVAPSAKSSTARAESDAHLKATKIWTHKSQGTAYYLHSDGTLSLEKPKL